MLRIRKNYETSKDPRPALYVCSTPIGHLGDVTNRLLETLRLCDVVAAEDTRQTRKLLARFDIHPPLLVSCHEHNQRARTEEFIAWWRDGKTIAIVSDAGTPLVSDPGWTIVDAAVDHDVPVIPVPGPSAVLAALVGSRLPLQPFAFFGFLSRHKAEAKRTLEAARVFPGTTVFYEAPHRLKTTLRQLGEGMAGRSVVIAKELTKTHETFIEGTIEELLSYVDSEEPRGEYVVMLGPPLPAEESSEADAGAHLDSAVREVQRRLAQGESHAEAVREVAEMMDVKRRTLYQLSLKQ